MKKTNFVSYQETTPNYIGEMLDAANQETVLLTVIAHKQYDRLLPMLKGGYKVSIRVLETLKWCAKENFLRRFLENGFEFAGDYRHLLNFLNVFLGEKSAAVYIMENSLRMMMQNCNSCWCRTAKLLSPQQLAENGYWDELVRRNHWEVLADNGQIDRIINSGNYQSTAAVSILKRYHQIPRIIELGKFEWLTKMAGGEKLLCKHQQFELLYRFRRQLVNWTEAETLKELCRFPEGRELLYRHQEYQVLVSNGYPELLQKNQRWDVLACCGGYNLIDWEQWYHNEGSNREKDDFYRHAATAGKWQFLLCDCQRKLLLKHGKLFLWMQTFTTVKNSCQKVGQPWTVKLREKFGRSFRLSAEDDYLD